MVVEFSILPLGQGVHFSAQVAAFIDIVEASRLPYQITPMGTVVEGTWDEVMGLIRHCHEQGRADAERVITDIKIDDFPSRTGRLEGKIESVKKKREKKGQ